MTTAPSTRSLTTLDTRRDTWRRMAEAVKDEPTTSPLYAVVEGHARALSWLPGDVASLAFFALVKALRDEDRAAAVAALDELGAA